MTTSRNRRTKTSVSADDVSVPSARLDDRRGRRSFITRATSLLVGGSLATRGPIESSRAAFHVGSIVEPTAESYAGELYASLSDELRRSLCFGAENPLRRRVSANWSITKPTIDSFSETQQDLVLKILKSGTSESGFEKFKKQMDEDSGGVGAYHVAFFGKPTDKNFEFVLTGRHATLRVNGDAEGGPSFGGPIVYGHQGPTGDLESADHRGNVFWYQAIRANEVFKALDSTQRDRALCSKAPREDAITHRAEGYPGLAISDLSTDQKKLVESVMADLLAPFRKQDVDEVLATITANGGVDRLKLAFFRLGDDGKSADNGDDGVWDVWRLEGPGFVWHFRGNPHVHVWVNIDRVATATVAPS